MAEAKPFKIPKRLVWEAYQRVRVNRGAAGVDGVSLAAFEKDLKRNLYKVWNRMSSGSPGLFRLVKRLPSNGRYAAMGRQCHVEIRLNLNESAFGLITDNWERAFREVLWM